MVARAKQTLITVRMRLGVGLSSEVALRTIPAEKKGPCSPKSAKRFLIGRLGDWDHADETPLP